MVNQYRRLARRIPEDFKDPLEAIEYIDGLIYDYKEGYFTALQVLVIVEAMKMSCLDSVEKIHG